MLELSLLQKIAIGILPILLAVTVHEAAHGYVANAFGDPTARRAGRLSLNPIRHVDWLGTIVVPLLMYLFTQFVFGWAKPVPINAARLRNPRRDMFLVAAAGPGVNVLMAVGWALVTALALKGLDGGWTLAEPLALMGQVGIFINLILAVFNLLPILPLDGGRMLVAVLPPRWGDQFSRLEPWGLPIVVVLLVSGVLGGILVPIMGTLLSGFNAFVHVF
ncbi:MAG: site-2 protease family protein [Halothiobacillaceae bacterium]|nr:site-2 protease family protein [Halothiobacillaceae bacterium]HER34378.1 site-2 protease family protein [Halothiobacillaceae bacterium]